MEECYRSFNDYLQEKFGERVYKISLNAGFTCPNKDGTLDKEGCIFCNEKGFSDLTENVPSIKKQIEEGIAVCKNGAKANKFIAYFQNATNTHRKVEELKKHYDTVKLFPDIVGLFISTRPDCIDDEKLDLIESYSKDYEVWIEYGVQTSHDATLLAINRKHTFKQAIEVIEKTSKRNIKTAAHIILGLPGESTEDIIKTANILAKLPLDGIKLHILHVLRDTKLNDLFKHGKIKLLEEDEYINLTCDFIERLKPDCVILRLVSDARNNVLVAPKWINEKPKVIENIRKEFKRRNSKQGKKYGQESMCIR